MKEPHGGRVQPPMQQPTPPAVHALLASILTLSPRIASAMFGIYLDDTDGERPRFEAQIHVGFTDGGAWSTGLQRTAWASRESEPSGTTIMPDADPMWTALEQSADDRATILSSLPAECLGDNVEWSLTRDDVPVPFAPTEAAMTYLAARGKVDPQ